jgi:hypothetical protein
VTFTINGKEKQSPWPEAVADELKAVSFYEDACGDTYISHDSELTYRPSALVIIDGLISRAAVRHGAGPRLRAGAARVADERAGADRSGLPCHARILLVAARGRRRRRGNPSESTAEKGREFLGWCTRAVVDFVPRLEDVHGRIELGYLATRPRR